MMVCFLLHDQSIKLQIFMMVCRSYMMLLCLFFFNQMMLLCLLFFWPKQKCLLFFVFGFYYLGADRLYLQYSIQVWFLTLHTILEQNMVNFSQNFNGLMTNVYIHLLQGMRVPSYDNQLLNLAVDLGRRLLPAFDTPTGIVSEFL